MVNDEANCPQKCDDGTYLMQGMECPPPTGQVNVTKLLGGCFEVFPDESILTRNCADDDIGIAPNSFDILVSGNNANPSEFPGSNSGTLVTIEEGLFSISEQFDEILISSSPPEICSIINTNPNAGATFPDGAICAVFSENCDGSIEGGENQECSIENYVLLFSEGP